MADLKPIQDILGTLLQVVAVVGIPLAGYKFYIKDRSGDEEKLNNQKEQALALANRIELLKTELAGEIKNLAATFGGEVKLLTVEITSMKINHLHTIEEKQKDQDSQIGKLTVATEKLMTIIDERIPRKNVEKIQ